MLVKRLRNLWALSNIEVKDDKLVIGEVKIPLEKPKMAQIIKREQEDTFFNEQI